MRRALSLFALGTLSGLAALAFNFLLRLEGLAAFPPESGLSAFLRVIPASIEEPAVQRLGDVAGELGLVVATALAAMIYGAAFVVFDRYASKRVASWGASRLEGLLALGVVPWLLFGLVVFPLGGDSLFGVGSPYASAGLWAYPLTLLLVQGVFALVLATGLGGEGGGPATADPAAARDLRRREFIEKGAVGGLAVLGVVLGVTQIGRLLGQRPSPSGGGQPIDLQGAPAIFSDPRLSTLVDSEVTPNGEFYRVAIDIIDPSVDATGWSLVVDGLVGSPKALSLQDIQSFPEVEQYTTLECVSNQVNGNLVSNARWGGVKVSDVLANAGGAGTGAKYVVFYSVDGYSVGVPLSKAMMPDSLLAYDMNGVQLPVSHGYPLRGLIPGLYGMMSAKWVKRISVVGTVYEGYWQTRGWTNDGRIYTETFIVLPSKSTLSLSQEGGSVIVGGYAFAGDRGVSKVEVSFDNGASWQATALKKPISDLTWALWAYEWVPAAAGEYKVIAKTTDGTGEVQTSAVQGTFPNGATGYAAVTIIVTD